MAAEHLCQAFPAAREGELARWLNRLVNSGACAEVARSIGLPDALRLDASASRIGARDSERVLGDACEALMAALYIDGGLDTARAFFLSRGYAPEEEIGDLFSDDQSTLLKDWPKE
jgi:ribonuclease-3